MFGIEQGNWIIPRSFPNSWCHGKLFKYDLPRIKRTLPHQRHSQLFGPKSSEPLHFCQSSSLVGILLSLLINASPSMLYEIVSKRN
ncbi:hypothetical protein Hdeb2414_s0004g00135311 [Helianthus debilis subsp. tardiflorus]